MPQDILQCAGQAPTAEKFAREVESTAGSRSCTNVEFMLGEGGDNAREEEGGLGEQERKAGEAHRTGANRLGSPDQLSDLVQVTSCPEPRLPCL